MVWWNSSDGWFFICNEKGCDFLADNFSSEADAETALKTHKEMIH